MVARTRILVLAPKCGFLSCSSRLPLMATHWSRCPRSHHSLTNTHTLTPSRHPLHAHHSPCGYNCSLSLSLSLSPLNLPIICSPPVLDSKHHVYLGLRSRPRPRHGGVGADQVRLRCVCCCAVVLLCCCAVCIVMCALCVLLTRTPSSSFSFPLSSSFLLFRLLSGALMTLLFLHRTISITRYGRQRQRETTSPCCARCTSMQHHAFHTDHAYHLNGVP